MLLKFYLTVTSFQLTHGESTQAPSENQLEHIAWQRYDDPAQQVGYHCDMQCPDPACPLHAEAAQETAHGGQEWDHTGWTLK